MPPSAGRRVRTTSRDGWRRCFRDRSAWPGKSGRYVMDLCFIAYYFIRKYKKAYILEVLLLYL